MLSKSKSKSRERIGSSSIQKRGSAAPGIKPFVSLRGGAAALSGTRNSGTRKSLKAHSTMSNAKETKFGSKSKKPSTHKKETLKFNRQNKAEEG